MQTDEQIITSILNGRGADYALLLRRHGSIVKAFIGRIVPSEEDAEELAQDTFVKAFRELRRYDSRIAPFKSWLFRIAYHETMTFLRRRKTQVVYLEENEALLRQMTDDDTDKMLAEAREARITQLEEAVRRLPPHDQTLVHLYYNDDLPLQQITFVLGHDAAYLATRLQRIRKKLCITIKTLEDEEQ